MSNHVLNSAVPKFIHIHSQELKTLDSNTFSTLSEQENYKLKNFKNFFLVVVNAAFTPAFCMYI